MQAITIIDFDIGKSVFQAMASMLTGQLVLRRQFSLPDRIKRYALW